MNIYHFLVNSSYSFSLTGLFSAIYFLALYFLFFFLTFYSFHNLMLKNSLLIYFMLLLLVYSLFWLFTICFFDRGFLEKFGLMDLRIYYAFNSSQSLYNGFITIIY